MQEKFQSVESPAFGSKASKPKRMSQTGTKPGTMSGTTNKEQKEGQEIPELQALRAAAKWHWKIAAELAHPILPVELEKEEKLTKLSGIRRQRERHLKFARVLSKAAIIQNRQKSNT